jgi:TRAP-type mannitol/chloroaromatic compound transport system permease small subunit
MCIIIEDYIITDRKDIPKIGYKIVEKQKYYFPDIYIPSENKIIEVKSNEHINVHKIVYKIKRKQQKRQDIIMKFGFKKN